MTNKIDSSAKIVDDTSQDFFGNAFRWTEMTFRRLWTLDTRAFEMVMGLMMVFRGLMIVAVASAMPKDVYYPFLEIMSETKWSAICLTAGLLQMGGVLINGSWKHSQWLRFTGGMISAVFFAMTATLFISTAPPLLLLTAIYAPLAVANFWSAINIASKS